MQERLLNEIGHARALYELAESIKAQGIMQAILVRPLGAGPEGAAPDGLPVFEIIAGERRFRAAGLAGLDEVPVLVRDVPALRRALDSARCDVLLVDMRGGGGLEAYRMARAAAPATAIVVIVDEPEAELAELCLREGAEDYMQRSELSGGLLSRVLRYATSRTQYTSWRVTLHPVAGGSATTRDVPPGSFPR